MYMYSMAYLHLLGFFFSLSLIVWNICLHSLHFEVWLLIEMFIRPLNEWVCIRSPKGSSCQNRTVSSVISLPCRTTTKEHFQVVVDIFDSTLWWYIRCCLSHSCKLISPILHWHFLFGFSSEQWVSESGLSGLSVLVSALKALSNTQPVKCNKVKLLMVLAIEFVSIERLAIYWENGVISWNERLTLLSKFECEGNSTDS